MAAVKAIFRIDKQSGEVFALFPEIPGSVGKPWECQSYQHMGQHSAADYAYCIGSSKPAAPADYADLLHELGQVGYTVEVARRTSPAMRKARAEEYAASRREG